MQLSTRGRYAVMALVDLAARAPESPARLVSLAEIAARQGISPAYLEQLFARLRRAGLVVSARGPSGGYGLARRADEVSIATVIRAVDEGGDAPGDCCLDAGDAGEASGCPTAALWRALCLHIHHFLDTITLADVVAGRLDGVPMPRRPREAA
jgi:Rrf2 family iron-sulfur cluster assembly transcriptional regulator